MIRVIVTGDDFGLHTSINAAMEEAHRNGILTSVSLIPAGEAFQDATGILKRNSDLGVGLHFTLVDGRPISRASEVSTLCDQEGRFFHDHFQVARGLLSGRIKKEHVRKEFCAQIEFCLDHGITLSHIDSHRHLHALPPVLSVVLDALPRYGLKRMRFLASPVFEWDYRQAVKLGLAAFFRLYRSLRPRLRSIKMPDFFVGFFLSGTMSRDALMRAARKMQDGKVYEMSFHPGLSDEVLRKSQPEWAQYFPYEFSWEGDLATLKDPEVINTFKDPRFSMISYSGL